MILRLPRLTLTDTLLPYTTLLRSRDAVAVMLSLGIDPARDAGPAVLEPVDVVDEAGTHVAELLALPSVVDDVVVARSEEHTSELQSLMRISYPVFCLTKKNREVQ